MKNILKHLLLTGLFVFFLASNIQGGNAADVFQSQLKSWKYAATQYQPLSQLTNATEATGDANTAIQQVTPGVVSIFGMDNDNDSSALEGLTFLFGSTKKQSREMIKMTAGTGFFIDSDGYILTNKHVVANENSDYYVTLANGQRKNATVVYRDLNNDLAVIKISGSNYTVLPRADSSKLKTGQTVMGMGNAYGKYPNTVSFGAIAGLHKTVIAGGEEPAKLRNLIQSTAQLYPGDSGGPLFNLNGEIVGINVAAAVDKDNVSFAIPISDAEAIVTSINQLQ